MGGRGTVLEACLRALTGAQTFQVGEWVIADGNVGKVTRTTGHSYKVLGRWYYQDEVEQASPHPLSTDAGHVVNPPESSRRYSSIWGDNAIGTGHARSMLDSSQAWSAKENL